MAWHTPIFSTFLLGLLWVLNGVEVGGDSFFFFFSLSLSLNPFKKKKIMTEIHNIPFTLDLLKKDGKSELVSSEH